MIKRLLSISVLAFLVLVPLTTIPVSSQPSNAIVISQLGDSVKIYRDNYGTPYVVAQNEKDLFFAHGYLQAMDRLFQLDGTRRIPQGRVSELIGDQQLSMDMWFAKLGFDRVTEESMELLDDHTMMMLQAFSDGINAYISDSKNTLPLEFKLMGYEPEPWTPEDSMIVMRLISWWLSVGMYQEMFFDDLVQLYGYDIAVELFPGVPQRADIDKSVKTKSGSQSRSFILNKADKSQSDKNEVPIFQRSRPPRGTNCWVVSGAKTESGKPILANDPHLELFSPAIWYEIGLSCPEWTSVGVVMPGLPIQQIGTNGSIAWGAAAFPADTQDLFREEINPENENQYKYDGKWLEYEKFEKKVNVRGGTFVTVVVQNSIHGPVIETGEKENLALAWTGFEPSDDISSFMNVVKARDVEQFRDAFESFEAIPMHFFAFDLDGNIMHVQPGRIPCRNECNGDLPICGTDSKSKWAGFIPFDEIPVEKNPSDGFLNNSNNFPPCDTGLDLGTTFPLPARFERVRELLSPRNDLTVDDMAKMQMDLLNPVAREILPLMLSKIDTTEECDISSELELLKKWDFVESPDSIAATIYNQWWIELPLDIFKPKLGIYSLSFRDYMDQSSLVMIDLLENGKSAKLWDWLEIGSEDNLKTMCGKTLEKAVEKLKKDYGEDKNAWQWGKVHKAHFAHPSQAKLLVDGGSYGVGGSRYTLNVTHYFPSGGFEATFGVSYRFIATIDENGRIVAQSVLPPGNLAAPLSPHFKDQAPLWVNGQLKEMKVYRDEFQTLPLALDLRPE